MASNDKNPFLEKGDDKLKPHIIDHPNPGCPTNAECSASAGKLYSQFKNLIQNKKWKQIASMQKKTGIPLDLWTKVDLEKPNKFTDLISWDSPCENHTNAKPTPINLSLIFARDLNEVIKDKKLLLRKMIVKNGKSYNTKYGLREGSPLFFSRDTTHYIRDIDAHYYDLALVKNNNIKLGPSLTPKFYPKTISCPEDLLKKAQTTIVEESLYIGFFCQQIWHKDLNKYLTVIQGQACF